MGMGVGLVGGKEALWDWPSGMGMGVGLVGGKKALYDWSSGMGMEVGLVGGKKALRDYIAGKGTGVAFKYTYNTLFEFELPFRRYNTILFKPMINIVH